MDFVLFVTHTRRFFFELPSKVHATIEIKSN